jgi:6-phosphogluconate dehydrogenase
MRNLSGLDEERSVISLKYSPPSNLVQDERNEMIEHVRRALYAAIILTYAQGFAHLHLASQAYQFNLDLSAIARIWRGGCIIRSALLEPIRIAYCCEPNLPHLLFDADLAGAVFERLADLQRIVQVAAGLSLPAPAFMASLAYYDGLRSAHSAANLIQALARYFGAHLRGAWMKRGIFHTH